MFDRVGCITHIELSVYQFAELTLPQVSTPDIYMVRLWAKSMMQTGPQSQSGAQAIAGVEWLAREFATAWQNGNPKP